MDKLINLIPFVGVLGLAFAFILTAKIKKHYPELNVKLPATSPQVGAVRLARAL